MRTIEIPDGIETMQELYEHFRREHGCGQFFDSLIKYANKPDVHNVVEFGVFQGGSTAALLTCDIGYMVSIDLDISVIPKPLFDRLNNNRVGWTLVRNNSLDVRFYDTPTTTSDDLLLLDTVHTYDHVMQELKLHGPHTNRYIIVHDTLYPPARKNPKKLVGDAVTEWANENGWILRVNNTQGSGHMVIERC